MSAMKTNKVVWSEGMFLRHQHFQQQDRHIEQLLKFSVEMLASYGWGFSELSLEQQHLSLGRIAVSECGGIFPDGTFFNSLVDCDVPAYLDVADGAHNSLIYLALPLRGADVVDVSTKEDIDLARYSISEVQSKDNTSKDQEPVEIQVATHKLQLLTDSDDLSQFTVLPIAKLVEKRSDGSLMLDAKFVPPCLSLKVSPVLSGFLQELQGLLYNRGEDLAERVTKPGVSGLSSLLDFSLLQLINRYETFFKHFANADNIHPIRFYEELLKLYGELITVTSEKKRLTEDLNYNQNDLKATFMPVFDGIRQSLSVVLDQTAIPLNLQTAKQGIRVALLKDKILLDRAKFVLAVKADVSTENLRTQFPAQIKTGPVEKIRGLINIALPGIALKALAVAPQEIPYHAGFTYFELDKTSQFWKHLKNSAGFAFHISGDFPGLELEFWAIKTD